MDPIDIFRTCHPNAKEYTFISSAHGTFSMIDYMPSYKRNLSNFKKIEIFQFSPITFFSNYKTETVNQLHEKSFRKYKHMKLKDMLLNNQWIQEKNQEETNKKKKNTQRQ